MVIAGNNIGKDDGVSDSVAIIRRGIVQAKDAQRAAKGEVLAVLKIGIFDNSDGPVAGLVNEITPNRLPQTRR